MIALTSFWVTLVFLGKTAFAAFGAGLALLVFGTLVAIVLLSAVSGAVDSLVHS